MAKNDTYKIAKNDLRVGVHLAHVRGDRVPVDNVERNGWGDQVVSPGTQAAAKIEAELAGEPEPVELEQVNDPGHGGEPDAPGGDGQ